MSHVIERRAGVVPPGRTLVCGDWGLGGVVVGEGDSYKEALADAWSAILFHIEALGS
jgi:hypothetical protein